VTARHTRGGPRTDCGMGETAVGSISCGASGLSTSHPHPLHRRTIPHQSPVPRRGHDRHEAGAASCATRSGVILRGGCCRSDSLVLRPTSLLRHRPELLPPATCRSRPSRRRKARGRGAVDEPRPQVGRRAGTRHCFDPEHAALRMLGGETGDDRGTAGASAQEAGLDKSGERAGRASPVSLLFGGKVTAEDGPSAGAPDPSLAPTQQVTGQGNAARSRPRGGNPMTMTPTPPNRYHDPQTSQPAAARSTTATALSSARKS
jgi:hypothetical protein